MYDQMSSIPCTLNGYARLLLLTRYNQTGRNEIRVCLREDKYLVLGSADLASDGRHLPMSRKRFNGWRKDEATGRRGERMGYY